MTGVFERQLCGYWCLSFPRATSVARFDQGVNDSFVGVADFALVSDDALAFETRRLLCERAVLIDRVRNSRLDTALLKKSRIRGPELEVLTPMTGRGVDEARARFVRHMVAVKQRNGKRITARMKGCAQTIDSRALALTVAKPLKLVTLADRRLPRKRVRKNISSANLRPIAGGHLRHTV